jgi:UDP-N-acetylmuramoyl-L-alanyl-D-glutamate--2,6-diaminopimelate ligase
VAMELSSHALDQQRTAGLGLDVALITNLGRDHLDYHSDMDSYLEAKAKIRNLLRRDAKSGGAGKPGIFAINVGDEGLRNLAQTSSHVLRFCAEPTCEVEAELKVVEAELSLRGTSLKLLWQDGDLSLESPLVGRFNVENLTAAMAVGLALGLEGQMCAEALAGVDQVPGRLERFVLPNGAVAVVDYAHTHDALAAVLDTCTELTEGRMLVVFGCGGDRDRGKRALMAEVAANSSDAVWITSDNPRSEDPAAICQEIWQGYRAVTNPRALSCEIEVDRKSAIEGALAAALPGDVVVVAGKGHEDYQLVGDQVLHLDDREIVRDWAESA